MQLPHALLEGLERLAGQHASQDTKRAARDVSVRYRDPRRNAEVSMVADAVQATAYALTRMPATYAAVRFCVAQVCRQLPDWAPTSLLDAGAGTGASAWACLDAWPDITRIRMLERAGAMADVGRLLAAGSGSSVLQGTTWMAGDVRTAELGEPAELVTAAYVFNEVGEAGEIPVMEKLWEATGGVLLVVEPGTPEGWRRVLRLRQWGIEAGAHMVGPCPHVRTCPVAAPDWCHFTERVNRSRAHRQFKDADAPYEDEKFSWVALSRLPVLPVFARIRRHPEIHAGYIRLSLCTKDGLREETVTRSRKRDWKRARDVRNGDGWALEEATGAEDAPMSGGD